MHNVFLPRDHRKYDYFKLIKNPNLKLAFKNRFLRESNRILALQHTTQITHFLNYVILFSGITMLAN